ncbi:MAG TPA: undecaprenyl-diphosphate phosphatase [Armatimonadetes bacterium]|nr:undecaprenyl-diphosphate phosphatase [Armatimonadota bacterium]
MSALEAITLAIIQGLTEFLPVSSSGHLALGHWLLGAREELPLEFVVLVHLGTLAAVVCYYRCDLLEILRDVFRPSRDAGEGESCGWGRRLLILLVVATLPAVVAVLFEEQVEALMNLPWAVGCALLVTGTALLISERLGRRLKSDRQTTAVDALLVGVAQAVAVVPGISRSGSTISAGLAVGFEREWAARFAFLMSVPAILGGTVFKLKDLIEQGAGGGLGLYAVCLVVSAVTGYLAIRLVIGAVQSRNLKWFAVYCYAMGLLAIAADLSGFM